MSAVSTEESGSSNSLSHSSDEDSPTSGQMVCNGKRHRLSAASREAYDIASPKAVLLLVKRDDDELVAVAVEVLRQLIEIWCEC